ncbi:MAG: hypothetical protein WBW88_00980 [Rhodothermales bacterium]
MVSKVSFAQRAYMSDFTAVLDRVQGDYAFYVRVQTDPDGALAEYELNEDERAALTDPRLLTEALVNVLPWSITIKISGRHDWVNRAPKNPPKSTNLIKHAAEALLRADNATARRASALQLIQLLD